MLHPDEQYCEHCGAVIPTNAVFCPKCGTRLNNNDPAGPQPSYAGPDREERKWLITLLLCLIGGTLGLHNFYNRKTGIGIAQLLTLGGCGIWTLIDLIRIIIGDYQDAEGNYLKMP